SSVDSVFMVKNNCALIHPYVFRSKVGLLRGGTNSMSSCRLISSECQSPYHACDSARGKTVRDGSATDWRRLESELDPWKTRQNQGLVGGSTEQVPPRARSATKSQSSRKSTGWPWTFATWSRSFTRERTAAEDICDHASARGQMAGSSQPQSKDR